MKKVIHNRLFTILQAHTEQTNQSDKQNNSNFYFIINFTSSIYKRKAQIYKIQKYDHYAKRNGHSKY